VVRRGEHLQYECGRGFLAETVVDMVQEKNVTYEYAVVMVEVI
jgi:hypothetical protein